MAGLNLGETPSRSRPTLDRAAKTKTVPCLCGFLVGQALDREPAFQSGFRPQKNTPLVPATILELDQIGRLICRVLNLQVGDSPLFFTEFLSPEI